MRRTLFTAFLLTHAILAAGGTLAPTGAFAQTTVATVNGDPITSREVEQRSRIERLMFRRALSRGQVIDTLIDDRVKLAEGRRMGMRVNAEFLDEMIGRMASGNRQSRTEFETALGRAGIDMDVLRDKVRADAVWAEALKQRARSGGTTNAEIDAELQRRVAKGDAKVTDYVLRQVIFVVSPGSGGAGQKQREANAARGRFTDCETGVEYIRTLRDAAVKERISRSSLDLEGRLGDMIAKTPVGRLTPPYPSEQGIEMIAVCEKHERQDVGALRSRIEEEFNRKRIENSAEGYLKDLKSKAEIVRR
jgi:peptidyl-prolyl cis-trans isomerase SurA